MTKKEIRNYILAKRNNLDINDRKIKSKVITERLISLDEYSRAKRVLVYIPYLSEVDITGFIVKSISDGKHVFAPTVCGDNMRYFEIDSLDSLVSGYKGILEPKIDPEKEYLIPEEYDLCIMPGAVFDLEKNRVGYGKGFYDRFLSGDFKGSKIAVCFDMQVVNPSSFETDKYDVKPNKLITEYGIY